MGLILEHRSLCLVRGFTTLSGKLSRHTYLWRSSAEKRFEMRNSCVFIPSRLYKRHVLKCSSNDNNESNIQLVTDEIAETLVSNSNKEVFFSEKEMYTDRSDLQFLLDEGSQISPYWINQLSQLPYGNARNLIPQLTDKNPVGFIGAKGPAKENSYQDFYLEQKKKHPQCVILMRTGEFYETMGVDALMLIGKRNVYDLIRQIVRL
jgi:hypothetical protein